MSARDDELFEDDGAGYLVSVSDIMAGLLFVFIITLMAFVIQFNQAKEEQRQTRVELEKKNEQITNNKDVRKNLLEKIQSDLSRKGVRIKIDADSGVLILAEDAVPFGSGDKQPTREGVANLEIIARVLGEIIPCYSHIPPNDLDCDSREKDRLEGVFVEGHTDSNRYRVSNGYSNWNLSSDRAIASFEIMEATAVPLRGLANSNEQALFSVSGYAARRPRTDMPGLSAADDLQRRIELRFIMTPPKKSEDIEPKRDIEAGGTR